MGWYQRWAPYVPVAQRRRQAEQAAKKLSGKGKKLSPILITGRAIATTFWGKAWCEYLEEYSDFDNRLPRGRTYARNGSIVDLQITKGEITALVSGSSLYKIKIKIQSIQALRWKTICSGVGNSIHSVIDLMRGKLSSEVIERLTDPDQGMFPESNEIKLSCSCPDDAYLCKHLAAVLYGVGHRLDSAPELLFLLRGVNQQDLVSESLTKSQINEKIGLDQDSAIATEDLGDIFGIELAPVSTKSPSRSNTKQVKKAATKRGASAKKKAVPKTENAVVASESRKVSKTVSAKTSSRGSTAKNVKKPDAEKGRRKTIAKTTKAIKDTSPP